MKTNFLIPLAALLLLTGCSDDGPPVSESDRAAGAEAHPQLLAEFGGAYQGDEAKYLASVGKPIAAAAGLEGQCRFTLVNSDVVNAFAVPGCYIYVTRGLMSVVNSEAELGAVLAHEVGHIAGRHAQRQQRRSLWRGLGIAAVGLLTGSEGLTRIAGVAAGLFTLRYSRNQEFEADDLGLEYLTAAGHDPHAAADMLATLGRNEEFLSKTRGKDEARSIPAWARTHPLSADRAARAEQAAANTGIRDGARGEHEARYVAAVDGLLYGDDPEQGFVIGRAFVHPVMRIAFEAPPGFTLTNSPQAILLEGPDGMRGEFAAGRMPPGGLEAYTELLLQRLLRGAPVEVIDVRPLTVNGLRALVTTAQVRTRAGSGELTIAAYDAGDTAYHFAVASSAGAPADLDMLFRSFRLLSESEARSLRPRVIDGVRASTGDTVQSLSSKMAGDNKLAHFLVLNGRSPDQPIRPGEPLKLVVYGERR